METVLKNITPENYIATVEDAAERLRKGQMVILPTETVYGIGANMDDPRAVERLIRLKNRSKEKPFTLHLAERSDLLRYAPGTHPFAHRLLDRYWPGPLTIVVHSLTGKPIGIRLPGLQLTRDIIRTAQVPIVLPSANPAGEPPACSAEQAMAYYDKEVDLVVDDGKTKIGDPSTVVKIMDDRISVVRTGIITEQDILNTACVKVLFICTGNTCRSPMAEGILKKFHSDKLKCLPAELPTRGYLIRSAGITAGQGEKASLNGIKALVKWNIDIRHHQTQPVSRNLIENADRVFVMTTAHRTALWNMLGDPDPKIELLDRKGQDILDPFGGSESVYLRCASQIYTNLLEIMESL